MPKARVRAGIAAATFAASALFARGALAHHSPAAYDMQAERTVVGTITEYDWGNPHVYLSVREVPGDRVWVVEAYSSTAMKSYGWSPTTFAVGDRVVVGGNPGRNAARSTLFLRTVRKAEATAQLFDEATAFAPPASGTTAAAARRASSLAGTWMTLVGPAFFNLIPPAIAQAATPRGAAAFAAYRDADGPGADCIAYPAPLYMSFPGFRRIELRDDVVVVRGEDTAVDRVVHLDVATHDGATPSLQGHSIGRWDDGVLVVDTAQFTPHALGNGAGLPSGPGKHLVERFALNSTGGLTYTFELEDPEYVQGRLTGTAEWLSRPDVEFAVTPCDPANARRFLAE
jgi:hypothetical protein